MNDTLRDGLRAIKNTIDDGCLVPGAGAFEITANRELLAFKETVSGKTKLGVQAYAEALLVIPKVLGNLTNHYYFCRIIEFQVKLSLYIFSGFKLGWLLSSVVITIKSPNLNWFPLLAQNAGFDTQDSIVKLLEESKNTGLPIGLDLSTGEPMVPADAGIYDNFIVKKQIINSW
jgi:T-complex protein 1 subunit zeta